VGPECSPPKTWNDRAVQEKRTLACSSRPVAPLKAENDRAQCGMKGSEPEHHALPRLVFMSSQSSARGRGRAAVFVTPGSSPHDLGPGTRFSSVSYSNFLAGDPEPRIRQGANQDGMRRPGPGTGPNEHSSHRKGSGPSMDLGLSDYRAIITGGSSGIGLGIARSLAREGVRVGIIGRDQQRLAAATESIRKDAGVAIGVPAEVTRPTEIQSAVARVAKELGGLDLAVACVGGHEGAPWFLETTSEDWTKTFQLNVGHSVDLARASIPFLRDTGRGSILFISSITGWRPGPAASYAAAKSALIHLAATLAQELGPYRIRVNALSPGSTADTQGWLEYQRESPTEFAKFLNEELPLHRLVTVEQVSDVACLMLSPRGAGINGANVTVDAGQYRPHAIRFPRDV
jgi:3-oxoacyl-[acyl-carrier protein] reductase